MMKKIGLIGLVLFSMVSAHMAVAKETISVVGSSSMAPLITYVAAAYMKQHRHVFIEVHGLGSSIGIDAVNHQHADIGMVSRTLNPDEISPSIAVKMIAHDGIAVVVNPKNSIKQLTMAQISAIYKGQYTNWQQLGGVDRPIVAISRNTASGTRGAFENMMQLKDVVDGKTMTQMSSRVQIAQNNDDLKLMVASNPYAIGYISLGTVDQTVHAVDVEGVEATVSNVKNGSYKVARPFLILYRKEQLSSTTQQFIDWMFSKEAQAIVAHHRYISVFDSLD